MMKSKKKQELKNEMQEALVALQEQMNQEDWHNGMLWLLAENQILIMRMLLDK
jgi:hypothetical protein